jgi:hypothetical protein
MNPRLSHGGALAGAILALVLSSAPSSSSAGITTRSSAPPKARVETTPFARVYLALRGCTSCSHCRTSIRQMVRSNAGTGSEATFGDDKVEVRYAAPRQVPLRDVIRSLAQSRLHDLNVVDVLFEATGTVASDAKGVARFVIAGTGQSFPISLQNVRLPRPGTSVRVVALVEGWRSKGAISLVAREVKASA